MGLAAAICRQLTADRRTDGELLAAFFDGPSEEAFVELVRRHGPLVWGTCRRLLPDPADAEDAFQAAFLVLVRRARGLTRVAALGPWLHRVAVWTARNVRRKNARRFVRQTPLPEDVTDPAAPPDPHLKFDLDAALLALPARYRDPIILCHLLGFTRREAAEQLGCPEGTLSAWLTRGLAKLRHRLRGLDPAKALAGAAVAMPAALPAATAKAAVAGAVAAASVPPTVSLLVEGVIRMFWVKKATAASFALVATFALGVGVGLGTRTESSGAAAQDKTPGAKPKTEPAPADRDPQLAEVEEALAATEAEHETLLSGVAAAKKRIDKLLELKADPKAIEDDLDALKRFQKQADRAADEAKALKDKLDKLKTAKQKVADPIAKPPVTDLDRKLAELKKQLDALQVEREKIDDLKKLADLKRAELEAQLRKLADEAKSLEAKRAELQPGGAKPAGAYLEVSVTGKDALWPCRVREFGTDGKIVVSVIAEDFASLGPLFSRAMKDPGGPREVRILTAKDTPAERVRAVLDACKQAGFQKVSQATKAADIDRRLERFDRLPDDIDRLLKEKVELGDPNRRWQPPEIDRLLKEKAELEDHIKRLEKTRPVKP